MWMLPFLILFYLEKVMDSIKIRKYKQVDGPRFQNRKNTKGAFTYDVRCFGGIFDLPTYPNQILYYISLFSKIRCSLTYLPTQNSEVICECSIHCDIISDCCWKNISCSWWRFVFGLWWQVSLRLHKAPRTKWPGISKGRWSSTAHQKTRVIAKISRIWKRNVIIRGRMYSARPSQMKIHT